MENTEFSAILNMLNEINKKVDTGFDALEKKFDAKIETLDKKIDALDKKFDTKIETLDKKIDALDKKFDVKFDALEEKVHNNSTNIITIINVISKIQKDIVLLRDDIETVYSLEKDSRQQLKRLL